MSLRRLFAGAALAAAIALPFTAATSQQAISFTISAVGGTGITGSGTISPGGVAAESSLNAQWQGLAPGSVHFVSQYHGTSCAAYDAAPEFLFSAVTADSQGKAAGVFTVKKPFQNWPNRPHFLVLHATAESASAAVACGMIVAAAPPSAATATAATGTPTPAPAAPRTGTGMTGADDTSSRGPLIMVAFVGLATATIAGFVAQKHFRPS